MGEILSWIRDNILAVGGIIFSLLMFAGYVFLGVLAFKNRHKLMVKDFDVKDSRLPESLKSFAGHLESEIRLSTEAHMNASEAASDINIFRDLAMPPRGEAIALDSQLKEREDGKLGKLPRLALTLFRWMYRPPVLLGEIYLAGGKLQVPVDVRGDTVTIRCRFVSPIQGTIELEPVVRKTFEEAHLVEMGRELALKIVLKLSPSKVVSSWKALDLLTGALRAWPESHTVANHSDVKDKFDIVEEKLLEALKHDSQSSLVQYNLGLLTYYKYGGKDNDEALSYFNTAANSGDKRLQYLGQIGLTRCYCQSYHRFGKQTGKNLEKSRRAADEAISLLGGSPKGKEPGSWSDRKKTDYARALYARAFSKHVTEKPDDIDAGTVDYLTLIALLCPEYDEYSKAFPDSFEEGIKVLQEKQPLVPTAVYNNLAYILMARGGRFTPGPDAVPYYTRARAFLKLALSRETDYKFARANLGNLERLLGDYEEAELHYKKALQQDPTYANGYSELAWVYLAWGKDEEAGLHHKKAIELAQLPSHKSKVKELYARAMKSVGKVDAARKLVREALELSDTNLELKEWIESPDGPGQWSSGEILHHLYKVGNNKTELLNL